MRTPSFRGERSRRQARRVVGALAGLAGWVALLLIDPGAAWAAGNDVGRNLGHLLRHYAGEVYGGVLAVVSLMFLVNRRYTELGLFLLAAVLVGWLVFSPDEVAHAARVIGRAVLG